MKHGVGEPPLAATLAMVFSMDVRVMICEDGDWREPRP